MIIIDVYNISIVLYTSMTIVLQFLWMFALVGMTNRKDMIDEALIRPGRLEVQMEISLPDEAGRVQILNIHTSKIKENGKLSSDVDIGELAEKSKNFSGAELAGLVRAAASTSMNRHIKVSISPHSSLPCHLPLSPPLSLLWF